MNAFSIHQASERRVKIVADSSADILALPQVPFASVPLKIITDKKEYVDDDRLSVEDMVSIYLTTRSKKEKLKLSK